MARLHPKEGSRPAQDGLMPFEGATQPAPAFAFAAWVVFLSKAQFGKDPRPQEGTEQAHEAVAQGVAPHHIGQQGLKALLPDMMWCHTLRYGLMGLFGTFLWPWVFTKLGF